LEVLVYSALCLQNINYVTNTGIKIYTLEFNQKQFLGHFQES